VRGTCCVVALSSESIGLVTVVPVTAGRHHERRRNNGGNDGNDGIANEDMRDSCDVGAVEWKRGFEPTRLLSEFKLDGALRACRIHPSNEYIVCLTSKGTLLIYHMWLGQLRGIIPTISSIVHRELNDSYSTRANTFTMDPSGLYAAVVVPWYERPTLQQTNINETVNDSNTSVSTVVSQGNVVVFYEILTGAYAGRIARRWPVGAIQDITWSPCGSRVAIATNMDHCASIYRLKHGMWDNVRATLRAVSNNSEFWTQHPIFLEPFRPTEEEDDDDADEYDVDEDQLERVDGKNGRDSGKLRRDESIASMSDALDAIITSEQDGSGNGSVGGGDSSTVLRTDRTGLATARRRLSAMVVAHSLRSAKHNVLKRILLPAD